MPSGYSTRCKTCNSPNRLQIEAWKHEGLSSAAISLKLRELNESISERALDNHFAEHYDVKPEVRETYYKSQAQLELNAQAAVKEIQILDTMVIDKFNLHQKVSRILDARLKGLEDPAPSEDDMLQDLPKLPMAYVSLLNGSAAEIRQCLKTKQELLGDDSETKKAQALQSWVDLMTSAEE